MTVIISLPPYTKLETASGSSVASYPVIDQVPNWMLNASAYIPSWPQSASARIVSTLARTLECTTSSMSPCWSRITLPPCQAGANLLLRLFNSKALQSMKSVLSSTRDYIAAVYSTTFGGRVTTPEKTPGNLWPTSVVLLITSARSMQPIR